MTSSTLELAAAGGCSAGRWLLLLLLLLLSLHRATGHESSHCELMERFIQIACRSQWAIRATRRQRRQTGRGGPAETGVYFIGNNLLL